MAAAEDEELVALLQHMTDRSAHRSELSAERSYQNAERNLSLLMHAGAVVMVLGLSLERYLTAMRGAAVLRTAGADAGKLDAGVVMLLIGMLMALAGGLRYFPYILAYHRDPHLYPGRSAYLALTFALLVAAGGIVTLGYLLMAVR